MTRRRLPDRRRSSTTKVRCGRFTAYIGVGTFNDGTIGEVWIDVSKAGTDLKAMGHAFALTTSIALQHGASVTEIADALKEIDADIPRAVARQLVANDRERTGT